MLHALFLCSFAVGQQTEIRVTSPDQRSIVISDGTKVERIDAGSQKTIWRFQGSKGKVTALAFSPDGKVLAVGSDGNEVRLLDVPTGKELWRTSTNTPAAVMRLTFSPDGKSMTIRLTTQAEIKLDARTGEIIAK